MPLTSNMNIIMPHTEVSDPSDCSIWNASEEKFEASEPPIWSASGWNLPFSPGDRLGFSKRCTWVRCTGAQLPALAAEDMRLKRLPLERRSRSSCRRTSTSWLWPMNTHTGIARFGVVTFDPNRTSIYKNFC